MASIDQQPRDVGENGIISRQDIEAAMAKAVELRALHASLMQGKCSSASPLSRHASYFSAQDYPVFTPVSIASLSFFFVKFINADNICNNSKFLEQPRSKQSVLNPVKQYHVNDAEF